MIPNLNFYDIYGYLLPGLTFLSLFWLPFGLIQKDLPSEKWSSALVGLVLGYVSGHVLQIILQSTLPSDHEYFSARRFSSDRMLDADDSSFTQLFKTHLAGRIKESFGIDVDVSRRGPDFANDQLKSLSQSRVEAWYLCRSLLLIGKANSYGEQFQGLSVLMRGLVGAFGLGLTYHLGFAAGNLLQAAPETGVLWLMAIAYVFVTVVLLIDNRRFGLQPPGIIQVIYAVIFGAIGFFVASRVDNWSWAAVILALSCGITSLPLPEPSRFKRGRLLISWFKVSPLLLATAAVGYSFGIHWRLSVGQSIGMIAVVMVEAFVAFKCHAAYGFFGKEFVKAIYQSFDVFGLAKPARNNESGC